MIPLCHYISHTVSMLLVLLSTQSNEYKTVVIITVDARLYNDENDHEDDDDDEHLHLMYALRDNLQRHGPQRTNLMLGLYFMFWCHIFPH